MATKTPTAIYLTSQYTQRHIGREGRRDGDKPVSDEEEDLTPGETESHNMRSPTWVKVKP